MKMRNNRDMGWNGNEYFYSKHTLRTIAANYLNIYEGLPLSLNEEVVNPWALAEYKADFDMALRNIGRGRWIGEKGEFKSFRHYGRLQQIIIADIMGIDDYELEDLGFYDISRLKGYAYYLMQIYLNGGNNVNKN